METGGCKYNHTQIRGGNQILKLDFYQSALQTSFFHGLFFYIFFFKIENCSLCTKRESLG